MWSENDDLNIINWKDRKVYAQGYIKDLEYLLYETRLLVTNIKTILENNPTYPFPNNKGLIENMKVIENDRANYYINKIKELEDKMKEIVIWWITKKKEWFDWNDV